MASHTTKALRATTCSMCGSLEDIGGAIMSEFATHACGSGSLVGVEALRIAIEHLAQIGLHVAPIFDRPGRLLSSQKAPITVSPCLYAATATGQECPNLS